MIFREKLSFDAHHTSIFIQQETLLPKLSGIATDAITMRVASSAAAHSIIQRIDRLVDVFHNRQAAKSQHCRAKKGHY